jgi:hypothetical protein
MRPLAQPQFLMLTLTLPKPFESEVMSTTAKEVKDRTTTETSRYLSKHNRQELVLHAGTQKLHKEPRNTIFDENGELSEELPIS